MKTYMLLLSVALLASCGTKSKFSGDSETPTGDLTASPKPADAPATAPYSSSVEPTTIHGEPAKVPASDSIVPARAVKAGSFEVWAEPPFPDKFTIYTVYVKVTLTNKDLLNSFSSKDVNGNLSGTDGFTTIFNANSGGGKNFEKLGDGALLHYEVFGGGTFVEDTVVLNSVILNESQVVKIIFQETDTGG